MRTFNYTWSEEVENMKQTLCKKVGMTTKQINREYLIKLHGQGYNQLLGVGGLLELIGLDRAAKMIERANNCTGDVCRCRVYGQDLQISFYIH